MKSPSVAGNNSYIDIGFGDDKKAFAGFHRFEIIRDEIDKEEEGVTIWYSSMSCNPSVNRQVFPRVLFIFHRLYAMCLFRDGIARVLEE